MSDRPPDRGWLWDAGVIIALGLVLWGCHARLSQFAEGDRAFLRAQERRDAEAAARGGDAFYEFHSR